MLRATTLTVLLLLGVGRLEAGLMTSTVGFSIGSGTQSLLLPQFDPALGTLTSVQFHLNGIVDGGPAFVNASGQVLFRNLHLVTTAQFTPRLWRDFELTAPGVSFDQTLESIFPLQSLPAGASVNLSLNKSVIAAPIVVGAANLASYIGTGTTSLLVSGSALGFTPLTILGIPTSVSVTAAGTLSGNLRVRYLYDEAEPEPPGVPEPSSLVLLAIGGLLGATRIRRRRG
jgi:hypothetical protein